MLLTDDILKLPGVGGRYSDLLKNLSISTIGDLLQYYPSYYKDSSEVGGLATLDKETKKTVTASLIQLKNVRLRNGKYLQTGILSDGENILEVIWFNKPFLTKTLKPPINLILTGKLNPKKTKPQFMSPDFEIKKDDQFETLHMGRIVPVYNLTQGISSRWIRTKIKYVVENIELFEDLVDPIPQEILTDHNLIGLKAALNLIHFPNNKQDIIDARKRLGFDELLLIQKKLLERRREAEKEKSYSIRNTNHLSDQLITSLPYDLTSSQKDSISEIHSDLRKPHPMRRLLQGDVGSGKTIVALLSALPVLEEGLQVVLLAPTAILAQQHYQTISKLLGKKYKIGLITKETAKQAPLDCQLLIGTHAILVHKDQLINKLALLIIDEQHRFGVGQRRELLALRGDEMIPHLLQLTATPIPRSIALTLFGDYDVSKIYPPTTRKIVKTLLVPETKREDSIKWINSVIDEKGQAFWIFPAIEESELSNAKSLEAHFPLLKTTFANRRLELVHGKLNADVKDSTIDRFQKGKTDILVSTTVVEVGIDIPGANLIVIEDAHRFGLAQLHQLRGRVGRNNQESWCLLYYNEEKPEVRERLEYFAKESDGIKIAEFDLQRRGPGEVYGTIQSGLPNLKIAKFSNLELLKISKTVADTLY